jgi:hypothetical protein
VAKGQSAGSGVGLPVVSDRSRGCVADAQNKGPVKGTRNAAVSSRETLRTLATSVEKWTFVEMRHIQA